MRTNFSAGFRKYLEKCLLASPSILGLKLKDVFPLGGEDKIIKGDYIFLLAGQFIVQFSPRLPLEDGQSVDLLV